MSGRFRTNIKMAITLVRTTKWRSLLTMLGVIIGVFSVVTVIGIGEGIKRQVSEQIDKLGHDLITIRPGQLVERDDSGIIHGVNVFSGVNSLGSLDQQDLVKIQRTKGVDMAVPLGVVNGQVKVNSRVVHGQTILATSPELPEILRQEVAYGGFFSINDGQQYSAVVGSGAARSIFGENVPLGHSFSLLGQTFIVQGVLGKIDASPLSGMTDFNNAIFIPYQTAQTLTNNNTQVFEILAKPVNDAKTNETVSAITKTLKTSHKNQQQFTVLRQDENLAIAHNILNLLTWLIAGIAAISLIVGGIGIMDVMLVSVTERMHEIGLRKAIGATNRQILSQFIVESTVLSLCGGLIGVAAAYVLSILLHIFTNLSPFIPWQAVVLALGVSTATGIIFGSVPALKAARKDPIAALRNE